jgi:hypothetical protein
VKPEAFSYCGVDCNACDVFKATVHGDAEALERAHKLWTKTAQKHWGMQTLDPAILKCKGCRCEGTEIFKGCRHCPIRRCAKGRDLSSCGLCPDWKQCERLTEVFADEPQARPNLERIDAACNKPDARDGR